MKKINLGTLIVFFFSATAWAMEIFPLKVENEWTYKVSSNYPRCPDGEHTSKVVEEQEVAGRIAFKITSACSGYGSGFLSENNQGAIDSHYNGSWYRNLDLPLEEGHRWQEFRIFAEWRKIDSVRVPAGTFTNCWRKKRLVTYTHWEDYCIGVGLVRSFMKDLAGGYISMSLISYSVN
ncbi:MAG: hypothetical protein R3B45_18220 [Bdellovibrionota bacterium]